MRGMNRTKLGLAAVAFVVIVGVLEVLALKLGSPDFPDHSAPKDPAIADTQGK